MNMPLNQVISHAKTLLFGWKPQIRIWSCRNPPLASLFSLDQKGWCQKIIQLKVNSQFNRSRFTCETWLTHWIRTRSFDGRRSIKSWCTIMMLLHSLHRPVCWGCPTMATRFGHLQDFPSKGTTGKCLGSFASDANQPASIDWQPYLDRSVNHSAMTGNWFDSNNWILSGASVMVHSAEIPLPPFLPEERPKRPKCSESSGNPKARLILSFQKRMMLCCSLVWWWASWNQLGLEIWNQ